MPESSREGFDNRDSSAKKFAHFAVFKIMLNMVKELVMLIMTVNVLTMLMMTEILDCHSSHRATQSGQAKSCHKSDCLMITFQFGNSGHPNFGDPNLPARQPVPQQSCALQAGRDLREAWRALLSRTVGSGRPSEISN